MTEKGRDTSQKRESILDAAQEMFVKEGYENSSMDRIAEAAGASKRTVYNHFPSKGELFQAVLNRFVTNLKEMKQIPYDAEKSLEEQLGAFIDTKVEFARNEAWQGLMRMAIGVIFRYPEMGEQVVKEMMSIEDTLVAWLEAACQNDRLRVADTRLASTVLWSGAEGAFFWPSVFLGPVDASEAERIKEELIQNFLARYRV